MDVRTWTLAERPGLEAQMWAIGDQGLPEFMFHDPVVALYFDHLTSDYAEYVVLACDSEDPDTVLARGLSVPFAMGFGRRTAPARRRLGPGHRLGACRSRRRPRADPCLRAGDQLRTDQRGNGISPVMLAALKTNAAARADVDELVAPLRPNLKHLRPRTAMADYVLEVRADGLPADPWLRVHVRRGGEIVAVCPTSMTVTGTLAQWRDWTGLPFDQDGDIEVPGALAPVLVRVAYGYAVYVEPNVWIRHRTR